MQAHSGAGLRLIIGSEIKPLRDGNNFRFGRSEGRMFCASQHGRLGSYEANAMARSGNRMTALRLQIGRKVVIARVQERT